MKIKLLTAEYLDSLHKLLKKTFKEVDTSNHCLEKIINNDKTFSVVGIIDDKVIANIIVTIKYDYVTNQTIFYLDYFCVDDKYQHNGYGSQLFQYIQDLAVQQKVDMLQFTSNKTRTEAHTLYEKFGCVIKDTNFYIKEINK